MSKRGKCGTEFVPSDGSRVIVCDREDRHIVHRESATGTTFVWTPTGAYVTTPV